MSDVLTIINAMRAAGCDDETILKAIEAAESQKVESAKAEEAEKVEKKREADKLRKRRRRSEQRLEIIQPASATSARTTPDAADRADIADPSPHTPHPESISPLKKTPKGVQKGPKIDRTAVLAAFDRIWPKLPPQAKRRGQEACRMAMLRTVASGAAVQQIEAAVGPWLEKSDGMVERFDRWVSEGMWEAWVPEKPAGPDWMGEIELYKRFGDWRMDGPPPDQPGCKAPPDLLDRAGYPQLKAIDGGRA